MTIEGFCKERGISKASVYRRLKEAGIELNSLRGTDGELTTDALQVLAALTDKTRTWVNARESYIRNAEHDMGKANDTFQAATQPRAVDTSKSDVSFVAIVSENETLKRELAETQTKLEAANARIAELLQQAAERADQYAQAMQRIAERTQEMQLLTAQAGPNGRGLWERIKDAFKREKP